MMREDSLCSDELAERRSVAAPKELDLNGSRKLRRRLRVSLSAGGHLHARVTLQARRVHGLLRSASHESFAYASDHVSKCSILRGTESKGLRNVLLVNGAGFQLTDDEVHRLVETFGLREWP